MRVIETKVYQFDELNEDAKQTVLNNLYSINIWDGWWDFTYEDAAHVGVKITGFGLDRDRHAKGEFTLSAAEVAQNISTNHGETCDTYITAEQFMNDWQPLFNRYTDENNTEDYESRELEEEMQNIEDEFLYSLLEDYSQILQEEYEYLTSEEAIIESIYANGYEFDENGKMI
jgi:hypothetical protein